ncbi:MAG: hypothetical protein JNK45_24100, partial [Myxococcales bacterium]|nr:hypothetical protein [Myxococcales bacterium]
MHGLVASIAAVLGAFEPPPPPNPEVLELHWRAPPGCPTQEDLERRIRALLPGEPSGEGVLVVEGEVTTSARGATLVLRSTLAGRTESRELASASCGELLESTAVLLAVALEPSATIPGQVPRPDRDPVPPPPSDTARDSASDTAPDSASGGAPREPTTDGDPIASPVDARLAEADPRSTPDRADRRRARAPRRAPPSVGLRIAAGIEAGAMPPPSAALAAAFSLSWPRARLEVHGTWLAPRTAREVDGRGATYQLGTAGARGCGRVFVRAVELPVCAGGEGGALRVRPRGLDAAITNVPWVAAIAGVGIVRAWGPVAITATIDGVVRLVGHRFDIDDAVSLRQFPVSARALVGVARRPGAGRDCGPCAPGERRAARPEKKKPRPLRGSG